MNLPGPRTVRGLRFQETSGLPNQAEEGVHADRIVGTPDQSDAVGFNDMLYGVDVFQPASCAHHNVDAQGGNAFDVAKHGGGNRKIDRHVDAAEVFSGDALKIGVIEFIQLERYREAVFGRELFDHTAHLAVADNG